MWRSGSAPTLPRIWTRLRCFMGRSAPVVHAAMAAVVTRSFAMRSRTSDSGLLRAGGEFRLDARGGRAGREGPGENGCGPRPAAAPGRAWSLQGDVAWRRRQRPQLGRPGRVDDNLFEAAAVVVGDQQGRGASGRGAGELVADRRLQGLREVEDAWRGRRSPMPSRRRPAPRSGWRARRGPARSPRVAGRRATW